MSENYKVRVLVHLSALVETNANSQKEAEEIVTLMYNTGEVMGTDIQKNDYYDGMELDVEN